MVDFSGLLMEVDYASVIQEWVGIILLTLVIAFALPIVFVVTLRYTEKYDRESWRDLMSSFIWGATVAVVFVILIRGAFKVEFRSTFPQTYRYIAAIVVTPIVAEFIKATGLFFNRDAISESEDGLIHGGTIGLGYSATENLLYGIFLFATYGFRFFVITMAIRSFSIVLINCVSTAVVCYGITRFTAKTHTSKTWYLFPVFYLAAVGISGTFNFFAMWGAKLFGAATIFSYSFSLIFSIVMAVIMAGFIYFKIYRLDRMDAKAKDQPAGYGGAAPAGGFRQPPQRQQYRPPPTQSRNVQTGYVPRGGPQRPPPRSRPPPRQEQRPPPRQQQRPPPRQQQRSLGPQSPPRPIGPHNKPASRPPARPAKSSPPPQPAKPSRPAKPERSAPSRPSKPAPSRSSKPRGKLVMEEEEELEFTSRKKGGRPSKRSTFEMEEEEVEFTSHKKSSSKKKSSSMDWEDDEDDYDDW